MAIEKQTGSRVVLLPENEHCACRKDGRPYCYDCIVPAEYYEDEPRFDDKIKPVRFKRVELSYDDKVFLGLVPPKPFFKKRFNKPHSRPRYFTRAAGA